MSELIELKHHDAVAEVALNRTDAYNAFNYEMVSQLANHLTELAERQLAALTGWRLTHAAFSRMK